MGEVILVTCLALAFLEKISSSMPGLSITSHLGYLSIGDFFIDSDLLEQHQTQRPINSAYVDTLTHTFESTTILHTESHVAVMLSVIVR